MRLRKWSSLGFLCQEIVFLIARNEYLETVNIAHGGNEWHSFLTLTVTNYDEYDIFVRLGQFVARNKS